MSVLNSIPEKIKQKENSYERLYPHWTTRRYIILKKLRQVIEKVIVKYVQPKSNQIGKLTLLDLGCGTMPYKVLFEPYTKYYGADLEANNQADLIIDQRTGSVDYSSHLADVIISTQVLEHVDSPTAYLNEAHRLCKESGILLISTHGMWPYHPVPKDYWRWTLSGLNKLLQDNYWEIVEQYSVINFLATSASLFQDAMLPLIPRIFKKVFIIIMQRLIGVFDTFPMKDNDIENSAVYLIVARPLPNEQYPG